MKKELFKKCQEYVDAKKSVLNEAIATIKAEMEGESKNSVGEDYDSTKEQLHSEHENLMIQRGEVNTLQTILNTININAVPKTVSIGALVITNKSNYYISIPAGKLLIGDEVFYAISKASPIGSLLSGKQVGDEIVFNGNAIKILSIE
jgi:transcription elongation GreA/GreB family factor